MNQNIRYEYIEWSMETSIDMFEHTKQHKWLLKAKKQFEILKKGTRPDGAIQMTTTNPRNYIGENGLAAWQTLRLYRLTKNKKYLEQAKKWINYIDRNPPKPKRNEPRLHPVFIAWTNYAYIELSKVYPTNNQLKEKIKKNCNKLLMSQKKNKLWSICYHYDLYVARHLLHAYNHLKYTDNWFAQDLFIAVHEFMQKTRYTKIPFVHTRPIHYLFFDYKGSGYSTLQYARLCFKMFLTTFNIDEFLEGTEALKAARKHLMTDGMVKKQVTDKKGNALATTWLQHCTMLQQRCEKEIKEWI